MPFRLWPLQVTTLSTILVTQLTLILKARQLGISWLVCAYALWHSLFQPGKLVLVFSKKETDANEMIRRVASLYARLPAWLKERHPLAREPSSEKIEWRNGSRIIAQAATEGAGRTWTASLLIMDEAAFIESAEKVLTAAKPTIDAGGQLILLSTANGIGNLFHKLWTKASEGANNYRTIFLPWWARPGRDAAWRAKVAAEATNPQLDLQEYPSTPLEAFQASQRTRFTPAHVIAQQANVRDPHPASALPESLRSIPGLKVWRLPWHPPEALEAKPKRLVIGADVAEGLETGDYSVGVLVDEGGEQFASLHGHWEPGDFAGYLHTIAEAYGAEIAVERNNHGHAVLLKLKDLHASRVVNGSDGKRGWLTNVKTKPQMIDNLAEWLRDGALTVRDTADLGEMQVYEIKPDGKTGAPADYHDDRVMAWAIALGVHKLLGSRAWKFT